MSISLPTYTRREMPLLSRRHRLRAIIFIGLRREFKRPATIVATAVGVGLVLVSSIVIVLFLGAFLPGQARDLSFFFVPASNGAILFTAFYTSVTLFLSSLTTRKSYAAAGVFAVTFGLTIPADILSSSIPNSSLLYVSPWEDYLAVARAAFGASGNQLDWPWALAILLAATVVASLATYLRMKAVEVVSG